MTNIVKIRVGVNQAKNLLDSSVIDYKLKRQLTVAVAKAFPTPQESAIEKEKIDIIITEAKATPEYKQLVEESQKLEVALTENKKKIDSFFIKLGRDVNQKDFKYYQISSYGYTLKKSPNKLIG